MADREKVIAGLTMLVDRKNDDTCEGLKCCKIAEDAIELLKEQDYRGWLMDMFHKYGRDDLIALLVLHGEENLLADLLKEQEAVKPKSKSRHGEYPQIVHRCGNCNEILYRHYKFCPTCGRQVKWE